VVYELLCFRFEYFALTVRSLNEYYRYFESTKSSNKTRASLLLSEYCFQLKTSKSKLKSS
jgi:hypothetical protein